jgi:hypothetical protein
VTSADDGSEHHLHLLRAGLYRLHPASATACVHVYPWPVAAVGRTVVACPYQRPRPSLVANMRRCQGNSNNSAGQRLHAVKEILFQSHVYCYL